MILKTTYHLGQFRSVFVREREREREREGRIRGLSAEKIEGERCSLEANIQ